MNLGEWDTSLKRPLLSLKQKNTQGSKYIKRQEEKETDGVQCSEWNGLSVQLPSESIGKKKSNKRGGWRCGLPWLVSTFLADNKACLCLDEPLWALSFHNPRPHSLCFADPLCQWIKIWAERMDSAFQRYFIKCRHTHTKGLSESKTKWLFFIFDSLQMCCFFFKKWRQSVWKIIFSPVKLWRSLMVHFPAIIMEDNSQPQGKAELTFPHHWSVKQRTNTRCSYKWTQTHNQ